MQFKGHTHHRVTGKPRTVEAISAFIEVNSEQHKQAVFKVLTDLGYTSLNSTRVKYIVIYTPHNNTLNEPAFQVLELVSLEAFKERGTVEYTSLRQFYNDHFKGVRSQDNLSVLTVETKPKAPELDEYSQYRATMWNAKSSSLRGKIESRNVTAEPEQTTTLAQRIKAFLKRVWSADIQFKINVAAAVAIFVLIISLTAVFGAY